VGLVLTVTRVGVDVADDVSFQIQLRVVLIDGEATGVAVAIAERVTFSRMLAALASWPSGLKLRAK